MHGTMVPIIFFLVIGYIIKVISDNRIKRLIIEKGMLDENVKHLYADRYAQLVPGALKWGMVLVAIGLALFLGRVLSAAVPGFWDDGEAITIAMMFIFGGAALITYYFIGNRLAKKQQSS